MNPYLRNTYVDPGLLRDRTLCEGCGRPGTEVHHIVHKASGGRHGAAKVASEDPGNKILLCRVCHKASHGIRLTESDGFWCGLCPKRRTCRFGARIADLPYDHLPNPWTIS